MEPLHTNHFCNISNKKGNTIIKEKITTPLPIDGIGQFKIQVIKSKIYLVGTIDGGRENFRVIG